MKLIYYVIIRISLVLWFIDWLGHPFLFYCNG